MLDIVVTVLALSYLLFMLIAFAMLIRYALTVSRWVAIIQRGEDR